MKITKIEVGSEYGGVIAVGDYENKKKKYFETIYADIAEGEDPKKCLKELRDFLHNSQEGDFALLWNKTKAELLQKQTLDIKFREHQSKKWPRVSSIIGWSVNWNMPEHEIAQYGARGHLTHKMIEYYTQNEIWLELKELVEKFPELRDDAALMFRGNLGLTLEDLSYKEFFEKYWKDFEIEETEKIIFNEEHFYTGQIDAIGKFQGKKSIIDWKTGGYEMKQLAAYAKADGIESIEQLVVCPVGKNDNKSGIKKPIICDNIKAEFDKFLKDRREFRERFGI